MKPHYTPNSHSSIFFFLFFNVYSVHSFLTLSSLLLLLPGGVYSQSLSAGLNKDSQQLISFKSTLSNPRILQNWLADQSPCNFTGVFCSNSRVSAVDLSFVPLSSDFKSVFSYLMTIEALENLSLKSTNLTGTISSLSSYHCGKSLSELDLANNGLSGMLSDITSLNSCSSLKSLNLSGNYLEYSLTGSGLGLNLESIDLSFNKISGQTCFHGCYQLVAVSSSIFL